MNVDVVKTPRSLLACDDELCVRPLYCMKREKQRENVLLFEEQQWDGEQTRKWIFLFRRVFRYVAIN